MKESKKTISCRILTIVDIGFTNISLSRKEFAKEIGISSELFGKMLYGNPKMTDDVLFKLVDRLKLEESQRYEIYDLYAMLTGDIPADVKRFLIENPIQNTYFRKLIQNTKDGIAMRGK